jgi:hypothetical protein
VCVCVCVCECVCVCGVNDTWHMCGMVYVCGDHMCCGVCIGCVVCSLHPCGGHSVMEMEDPVVFLSLGSGQSSSHPSEASTVLKMHCTGWNEAKTHTCVSVTGRHTTDLFGPH